MNGVYISLSLLQKKAEAFKVYIYYYTKDNSHNIEKKTEERERKGLSLFVIAPLLALSPFFSI